MDLSEHRYLVQTEWLAQNLDHPELRIIECTSNLPNYFAKDAKDFLIKEPGRADWENGRIPGSAYVGLLEELSDRSKTNFMYAMPSAEKFASVMSSIGVGDGTAVVLYDRRMNQWAARIWCMLHAFGFDNAAVLDGGWTKWVSENRPVSTAPPTYPKAEFTARPRPKFIATRADVESAMDDERTCLINALDPDEFAGRPPHRYERPGRIPGSVNVPFTKTVNLETQKYADDEVLIKTFDAVGAREKEQVICYCGGAIAASSTTLLLSRLGVPNVRLYDGSLTEWTSDPSLPMETG